MPAVVEDRPTRKPAGWTPRTIELARRAVESAVDAALGEVYRQAGDLGNVLREARSEGMLAARPFIGDEKWPRARVRRRPRKRS